MVVGEPEKLDAFSDLVKPFGIIELQRTGRIALPEAGPGVDPAAVGQDRPRADFRPPIRPCGPDNVRRLLATHRSAVRCPH